MGAWDTAIFSDDLAADIRASFQESIGDGLTTEAATAKLKKEFASALNDQDEAPVFWLALASVQWNLGRLVPEVLACALNVIDNGSDLKRWEEDEAAYRDRKAVLEIVRQRLSTPPPAPKIVPKRFRNSTTWEAGDVIGYRLLNDQICFFRIIGHHSDKGGRSPVAELIDWIGQEVPSCDELRSLPIRCHRYPNGKEGVTQFLLGGTSAKHFPKDRLIETGYSLKPKQSPSGYTCFLWRFLDNQLHEYFSIGH